MQTRRERAVQGLSATSASPVLYEKIEESFLKEDFSSVDRLATQFLSGHARTEQADEALYLQSLALLKLGRFTEGREKLAGLERQSLSAEMKKRAASSLTDSDYLNNNVQSPKQPLRQMALEENQVFLVQVGSFSKQKNAERILDRLLHNRYDAYVSQDKFERMFRVRVGRLTDRKAALALEERLKKDGYPTKIYP
jgi:hypothetical protein